MKNILDSGKRVSNNQNNDNVNNNPFSKLGSSNIDPSKGKLLIFNIKDNENPNKNNGKNDNPDSKGNNNPSQNVKNNHSSGN